jgi:hypothetical protein
LIILIKKYYKNKLRKQYAKQLKAIHKATQSNSKQLKATQSNSKQLKATQSNSKQLKAKDVRYHFRYAC